jgi:uracil phosphoribosyltransferase
MSEQASDSPASTTPIVRVVEHSIVRDGIVRLRDQRVGVEEFRRLCKRVGAALAIAATEELPSVAYTVPGPSCAVTGQAIDQSKTLLVPVLRAGLGILDSFTELLPAAPVATVGLRRDEDTLAPSWYHNALPPNLTGNHVFILDPMLATGGSVGLVVGEVYKRGADQITVVALLATAQGIAHVSSLAPGIRFVIASIDEGLDERGYIIPGLGDAGDRLFGQLPST